MVRSCFSERIVTKTNENDYPETYFKVEFREDGEVVAVRAYPGKSYYYVDEIKENWESGILQLETILAE